MCIIVIYDTHTSMQSMRTNIVIDDALMGEARRLTGMKTKRDTVELALKTLVRLKKQERIKDFRGKLEWEGDLDSMRGA